MQISQTTSKKSSLHFTVISLYVQYAEQLKQSWDKQKKTDQLYFCSSFHRITAIKTDYWNYNRWICCNNGKPFEFGYLLIDGMCLAFWEHFQPIYA